MERVVALIDMDCFYCQVELRDRPDLVGRPMAVVQYNAWQGGGIIAVSYEARKFGVSRNMRGDEARRLCPEIALVQVPELRKKADLTKYRDASKEVIDVLTSFQDLVLERASIDEAYVDLTALVAKRRNGDEIEAQMMANTFVLGEEDESNRSSWLRRIARCNDSGAMNLAHGAVIVEELRQSVLSKTGFHCSAGVACNKMLAKLACGTHKPRAQTVLPNSAVAAVLRELPVHKLRGLGGKLGLIVKDSLKCNTVGELANNYDLESLKEHVDPKTANILFCLARGIDEDPVRERDLPKSIGCSKNFPGKTMLEKSSQIRHWIRSLSEEVLHRINLDAQTNNRRAKCLSVFVSLENRGSCSRQTPLNSYDGERLFTEAERLVQKLNESKSTDDEFRPRVRTLGVSVTKFEKCEESSSSGIKNFFRVANNEDESNSSHSEPSSSSHNVDNNDNSKSNKFSKFNEKDDDVENVDCNREAITENLFNSSDSKLSNLSKLSSVETELCSQCLRRISPFEMPEHLDFHLAAQMQRQWNKQENGTTTNNTTTDSTTNVATSSKISDRKRKSSSSSASSSSGKRQRDIASFFLKK